MKSLKANVKVPIELHTHYTSGVASMTYLKAVEAGVDVIDTAMSPFSMGTSQPATEVMVETFKGTEYDTGLDQNLLAEIANYFRPMQEEALKTGLLNPKVMGVAVICEGGEDPIVRERIYSLISALFDINTNSISVTVMA